MMGWMAPCLFRKFDPAWIRVPGQNRRIMKRDVCDRPCPWNASRGPFQVAWVTTPSYLIRDNDGAYGHVFTGRVKAMGIRDRPISPGSP
jgi:hypothetical protein